MRSDLVSEHKLTLTHAASESRNVSKQLQKDLSAWTERGTRRRSVERNVRSREEVRSAARELAAPQESKDVPIPPDSDPRKRRAMKATAVASSASSQMESSRAVAETPIQQNSTTDESRMDVEGEERDETRSPKAQNVRRRMMTKTSTEESRMDDQGVEGDDFRSSAVPITEQNVLVHSLVGIIKRERRRHSRRLWQQVKLWRDVSLKRAMYNWNMKYADVARSPGSAVRKDWRIT